MNLRFSALLRKASEYSLARSGGATVDRLLTRKPAPLPTAIDAPRHEISTSDAGVISYYGDSSAAGRPLVLVHGIHAAASAYEMRPLFESFRGRRPVYALDLPGFGFSERSQRAYTPATYVHALEHLLRNVASSQGADVIALSLSSEYAAKVAVDMPELVRSLVLISPTGFAAAHETRARERRSRRKPARGRRGRLGELAPSRVLYELMVSKPSLRLFLRRSFEQQVDDGMLSYAYRTSHQAGAFRAPLSFIAGDLFPAGNAQNVYAHVRVPTLVLYDRDPYTRFGDLEPFVAAHGNYAAQRIAPTRGLPQFDAPQQTAEALRSFYERLDAARPVALVDRAPTPNGTRAIGSA